MGCSRVNRQGLAAKRGRARLGRLGLAAVLSLAAPALLLPSLAAFAEGRTAGAGLSAPSQPARHSDEPPASGLAALPALFSPPDGSKEGPRDFFLFIKDYEWSLRYSVGLVNDSPRLDQESPLTMTWVKLLKPIKSPAELSEENSGGLFNWDKTEPAKHQGFMYHIVKAFDTGVEAVINLLEGKGLVLRVTPGGIQLLLGGEAAKMAKAEDGAPPHAITHCWVETGGMPWAPILTSMAFFNVADKVVELQA